MPPKKKPGKETTAAKNFASIPGKKIEFIQMTSIAGDRGINLFRDEKTRKIKGIFYGKNYNLDFQKHLDALEDEERIVVMTC